MHTIFITGATGNLGSRTLVEFLLNTDARCVVLVYAPNLSDAEEQIRKVLSFWNVEWDVVHDRLTVLCGDTTQKMLGLDSSIFDSLSHTVTHIIHCAAYFKLDMSLEDARRSIVEATENVAMLGIEATKNQVFKHFTYISSLDAVGMQEGTIYETFFDISQLRFLNTYQQAKAEAESYLHSLFLTKQFPITVVRPSMLVGDAQTGKIINPQSLYHIIQDMFLKPPSILLPGRNFRIDPMPINFLAHGMRHMYDAPETCGRVYHFVAGSNHNITIPKFIDLLQTIYYEQLGIRIKKPIFIAPLLPYIFMTILYTFLWGEPKRKVKEQRDMIRYFFLNAKPDNAQMKAFMESRGVEIPNITEYLPTLCAYIIQTQKLPVSLYKTPKT
ncbi:SDR family oxidoreductase [Candidatus Kaiserbacteria bacterium]|nr:MAG: SDR family oxidoreductase [Candidatus Kaiserbacteria bacterium]